MNVPRPGPVAAIVLAVAPSCDRGSPRDEIVDRITSTDRAVERHDADVAMSFVAPDYVDDRGHDRDAVERVVRGLLIRYPRIEVVTRVRSVRIEPRGRAHAELLAAVAGAEVRDVRDLADVEADLYRFDLSLERRDGDWVVVGAHWEPAGIDDFLP